LSDPDKTKGQLVAELAQLQQWISEVEKVEIEHLQVEEALRRRNRELELLNRAAQAFNSTLDLDQVLSHVLEEVCRLLGAVAASIWLIETKRNAQEGSSGDLVCRYTAGASCEVVRGWRLPLGQGIAGWVARSGESVIVPDTSRRALFRGCRQANWSALAFHSRRPFADFTAKRGAEFDRCAASGRYRS
jgi:putative methionine-R-sulfoxide reductase with GAF domain